MTSSSRWRFRRQLCVFFAALALSASAGGCSCGDDNNGMLADTGGGGDDMGGGGDDMGGGGDDMGGGGDDMGGGGDDMGGDDMGGGDMGMAGSGEISGVMAVSADVPTPIDATPSPDGETIYYVGITDDGAGGALFSVPAAGGNATVVAEGFIAPLNLVSSLDGATIFVADAGVDDETDNPTGGVVYEVAVSSGTLTAIDGTVGYNPRGLDIVSVGGEETLYFTGTEPSSGDAGVFFFPVGGSTVSTAASGAPISDPSGIAVTADGTVYLADTVLDGQSGILSISGGAASVFVAPLRVGYPAGIALSEDESHLLVSGLAVGANTATVYRITLADQSTQEVSMGIEQNSESAGVHRAHNADKYAWANADNPGTVYLIGTTADPIN